MGNVVLEINGHKYNIGCDDGQEEHLTRLSRIFETHVKSLASNIGQIGEQRLFLMAALLLADENFEIRQKLSAVEAELMRLKDTKPIATEQFKTRLENTEKELEAARNLAKNIEATAVQTFDEVSKIFDEASLRIENLADKID